MVCIPVEAPSSPPSLAAVRLRLREHPQTWWRVVSRVLASLGSTHPVVLEFRALGKCHNIPTYDCVSLVVPTPFRWTRSQCPSCIELHPSGMGKAFSDFYQPNSRSLVR